MPSGYLRIRSFPLPAFLIDAAPGVTFAGAQNFRGGINGTVTDQGGAAIPGAQVQITDDATGVTHSSVASSAGEFYFPDFPWAVIPFPRRRPALKHSRCKGSGFRGIDLQPSVEACGRVAGHYCGGECRRLGTDTTTPTQTTILSGAAIQDIPLNGRDFTQMIGMAPGLPAIRWAAMVQSMELAPTRSTGKLMGRTTTIFGITSPR